MMISQKFWTAIWNLSESTGISLGKFAPYVLGKSLGTPGKRLAKVVQRDIKRDPATGRILQWDEVATWEPGGREEFIQSITNYKPLNPHPQQMTVFQTDQPIVVTQPKRRRK